MSIQTFFTTFIEFPRTVALKPDEFFHFKSEIISKKCYTGNEIKNLKCVLAGPGLGFVFPRYLACEHEIHGTAFFYFEKTLLEQ